jgi:hypothetical protein
MHEAGRVVAVVPAGDTGAAIIADLAFVGIRAELVEPLPGDYQVEDESLREHVAGVEQGLFLGLGLGALVGLVVVLAVGATRDLSWVTQLLLVAGIALQGTIPAAMWRMGRTDRYDDDPDTTRHLGAQDRLVILHAPHDEGRARHVLERHDVVFLTDEQPRQAP